MANNVDNYLTILGGKRNVKRVLNYLKGDDGKLILEKIRKDYRACAIDNEFLYVESVVPLFSPYDPEDWTYAHFQVKDNTIYFYTPIDSPWKVIEYLSLVFPKIVFQFKVYDRFNPEYACYVKYLAGRQKEYKNISGDLWLLEEYMEQYRESLFKELFVEDSPSSDFVAGGSEETSSDEVTVSSPSEITYDSQEIDDLPF